MTPSAQIGPEAWTLVVNGIPVATHSTKRACVIEAYERKLVIRTLRSGPELLGNARIVKGTVNAP